MAHTNRQFTPDSTDLDSARKAAIEKARIQGQNRDEMAVFIKFWAFPLGLLAVAVAVIMLFVNSVHVDNKTSERLDELSSTYGITILDRENFILGELSSVKVQKEQDLLSCDILDQKASEIITCDSPSGRITLKKQ